jgi:hypothetical protein
LLFLFWERERETAEGEGAWETNLGERARTVRDSQCGLRRYGIHDTVVREFRRLGTVGRQRGDNNRGEGVVHGCESTGRGRSQEDSRGELHVEL